MNLPNSKETWEDHISLLQKEEEPTKNSKEEIIPLLANLLEETIVSAAKVALSKGKIGVLFSGGVDSTLICFVLKKFNIPFDAITVGFQDNNEQKLPDDILESRIVAKDLSLKYHEVILDFLQAENLFKKIVNILGEDLNNVVNVGVGSVELAGIQELKKIDPAITEIFGGLGSEEIFAGYKRHLDSSNRHEECWLGLKSMFERDLMRDLSIAKSEGIRFYTPFLDKELISFSMNIDDSLKLNEKGAKMILREAARHSGLPENFAFRPKKAAQYGSRTDRAIAKLAKQKGFKYKKDYINSILIK